MAVRYYINLAPTVNISPGITSGATTCSVSSFAGWPTSFPFTATLDYGLATAEVVLVTNIAGTVATITRGYDGTVAVAHASGATFDVTPVAKDLTEANSHINANAGVHGVSGSVVGTSDVQTLTNKTFTGTTTMAQVNATGVTATGTVQGATVTSTGAVNAATIAASGASTAASYTATGDVAGATAHISGTASVGAVNSTGAATAASFTASGDGTVSGVFKPKQYANEAAATAAGVNVAGNVVYLTAPTTTGAVAGLFEYSGGVWTALQLVDDTGWTTATLGNSWTSYALSNPVYNDPKYRRKNNRTQIDGGIQNGTTGTTIFTLPAGYRPNKRQAFIVPAGPGLALIIVSNDGTVQVQAYVSSGTNASVILTGISFIAEA